MSTFGVIIPAAGQSSRFVGFEQKKIFVELLEVPVWARTVDVFVQHPGVVEIVLVLSREDIGSFETNFESEIQSRSLTIVEGGASRAESVRNGMLALSRQPSLVAVHDAARPLLSSDNLKSLFAAAEQHGSVVPGLPVTSTVKRMKQDGSIGETIDRESLRLAQTPQVFRRDILENAYEATEDFSKFTDEASLVEATGVPVYIHPGWPGNIKITTAADFRLAEFLLNENSAE